MLLLDDETMNILMSVFFEFKEGSEGSEGGWTQEGCKDVIQGVKGEGDRGQIS